MNQKTGIYSHKYFGFGVALLATLYFLLPEFLNALPLVLPPRGVSGDLWADVILGQTDGPVGGGAINIPNSAFGDYRPNQASSGGVFNPGAPVVDRSQTPNRLYVWDAGNSRVLGFLNVGEFQPNAPMGQLGYNADIVLGQPDFSHCTCNGDSNYQDYPNFPQPSSSSLCGSMEDDYSPFEFNTSSYMAVDSQGNLYVPDPGNNRVLRYNAADIANFTNGTAVAAAFVWGQPDFTSYGSNQQPPDSTVVAYPSNSTLSFNHASGGAAIDPWGNLWVADYANNRVLRFPLITDPTNPAYNGGAPAKGADVVLGQPDFNYGYGQVPVTGTKGLTEPIAVRVDNLGNVYVSDSVGNGRIVIFEPTSVSAGIPLYTSGQAAERVITNIDGSPLGLEFDNNGNLWAAYTQNASIEMNQVVEFQFQYTHYPKPYPPIVTAPKVLLQGKVWTTASGTPNDHNPFPPSGSGVSPYFYYPYPPPTGSSQNAWQITGPRGVAFDSNGYAYVGGTSTYMDVWRFPPPGTPTIGVAESADVDIFKQTQTGMVNTVGPANFNQGKGVAVAENVSPAQLVISDHDRIMYWNMSGGPGDLSLANGKAPDGYAGVNATDAENTGVTVFGRVHVDQANPQKLWAVAENLGDHYMQVYNLPLTSYATPAFILNENIPVLKPSGPLQTLSLDNVTDMVPVTATNGAVSWLWVADPATNRVFRVRDPLGPAPKVDFILGQANSTTTGCNGGGAFGSGAYDGCSRPPTYKVLSNPGSLAMDHHGNLYISDFWEESNGNTRLLQYQASALVNNSNTCLFNTSITAAEVHTYEMQGSTTALKTFVPPGAPNISGVWEPAFTSDDGYMVVSNRGGSPFPVVIPNPLSQFDPTTASPWTTLSDYVSATELSGVFDNENNFYTTNQNRSYALVYQAPLPLSSTPLPTPTAIPTVVSTPSCYTGLPLSFQGLDAPNGDAADSNYLYVADGGNKELKVFAQTGGTALATVTGYNGTLFASPTDIALDSFGDVYVADYLREAVYEFGPYYPSTSPLASSSLKPLAVFSTTGTEPRGLWVETNGSMTSVYVSVQTATGGYIYLFTGTASTGDFSTTPVKFAHTTGNHVPTGVQKSGCSIYVAYGTEIIPYDATAPYTAGTPIPMVSVERIRTDAWGNFYTTGVNGLYVFGQAFNLPELYIPLPGGPNGVAVNSSDEIFVTLNSAGPSQPSFSGVTVIRGCQTPGPTPTFPCVTPVPTLPNTLTPTPSPTITPTPTWTPTPNCCQGVNESFTGLVMQTEGLAVAGDMVYVTDGLNQNKLLEVFPLTGGAPVESLATGPTGSMVDAEAVAVDGSGNIYVGDSTNGEVEEFSPSYGLIQVIGGGALGPVRGLAVTTQGATTSLFIATNQNIYQYNSVSGGTFSLVATYTDNAGSLPTGIVVVGGVLYVANNGNGEIVSFNTAGGSSSSPTVLVTGIPSVSGLVADGAGNFYVTNPTTLERFTSSWVLAQTCTGLGNVWEVGVDSKGKDYMSLGGGGVTVLQSCVIEPSPTPTPNCCQGVNESFTGLVMQTEGLAVAGDMVYVTDGLNQNKLLEVFPLTGGAPVESLATGPTGSMVDAEAVAVDGSGNIYVGDSTNGEVEEFSPSYGLIQVIGGGALGPVRGLAVTTQGATTSLFIATNQNIYQYNSVSGGTFSLVATYTDNAGSLPTGIVVVGGVLYVANNGNGEIVSFNTAGGSSSSPTVLVTGIPSVSGLVADGAGNFYVTNPTTLERFTSSWVLAQTCTGLGNVWEVGVDSKGKDYMSLGGGGVTVLQSCVIEPSPTPTPNCCQGVNESFTGLVMQTEGLAVAGDMVYVTDGLNQNKLLEVFPLTGGAPVESLATGPTGSMVDAEAVAVDGSGNIYVGDSTNGEVEEFSPSYGLIQVIGGGALGPVRGLAVTTQGATTSLFIATNQNIYQYNSVSGGTFSLVATYTDNAGSLPTGIVVVGGVLYVANNGNGEIVSFNTAGGSSSSPTVLVTGIPSVSGLVADGAGNFYVTNPTTLERFTSSWVLAQTCTGLGNVWEVGVDSKGKDYMSLGGGGVTVLQSCVIEPNTITGNFKSLAKLIGNQTPTPAFTPSPTITPSPTPNASSFAIAAPNISRNGEPIKFLVNLNQSVKVNVTVFTVTGENVYETSFEGNGGWNSLSWDLKNQSGNQLASGLYIYEIEASDGISNLTQRGKMVILH